MKESINNYGATFKRSPVFFILTRVVILFFLIIIIFPLLYTLSLSVRSPDTVYSAKYFLIPYEFSLQNYYDAFFYAEERLKVSFPRMFFEQIPKELTEAGIVDGASDFQLLLKILLPLAKPAIATCVILLFLDTWNEFIYAMIFMQDPTIHTVPVGLAKIGTSRYHINIGTYSASVMITIIPVMLIFAIFQRWFIAGMTMGALKH